MGFLPGMATFRFAKYVGLGHAKRILLTSPTLDAAEAARLGQFSFHVFAQVNTFWYVNPGAIEYGINNASGEARYSIRPSPFVGQGVAGRRIAWRGM